MPKVAQYVKVGMFVKFIIESLENQVRVKSFEVSEYYPDSVILIARYQLSELVNCGSNTDVTKSKLLN